MDDDLALTGQSQVQTVGWCVTLPKHRAAVVNGDVAEPRLDLKKVAISALKTTLKAEINADAWVTLNSDTSRAFEKPKNGRIAVKVINHLGDEVLKVFRVA
jgi:hypothetical protein